MTDKQIIIDNIDVSGCAYFGSTMFPTKNCTMDSEYLHSCESCYCYYKQLKRKEQECEELRQYHNKCCEEFEKEKKEWLKKYNQISRDFYNGKYCNKENCNLLKAKEQECEELKEKLQKYIDREQWEIELNKKRADSFKEMRKMLYGKFIGNSLIEKRSPYGN